LTNQVSIYPLLVANYFFLHHVYELHGLKSRTFSLAEKAKIRGKWPKSVFCLLPWQRGYFSEINTTGVHLRQSPIKYESIKKIDFWAMANISKKYLKITDQLS